MTELIAAISLELIRLCVQKYGLSKTILGLALFILMVIVLWQLPNLIIAWKT